MNKGIICGLTEKIANFEQTCPDFLLDHEVERDLLIAEEFNTVSLEDASLGQRFANMILDRIALTAIFFGMGMLFGLFGIVEDTPVFFLIIELIVALGYFAVLESATGQTIGKMITNTQVVTEKGEKISFGTALGRTVARIIPFEAFSFLGSEPRGWHDTLTRTKVVKKVIDY